MIRILPAAIALVVAQTLHAQSPDSASSPPRIQDNSFLVEEAYNQESGVVQHIGTMLTQRGSSGFEFGFAEEWPIGSITHQLSYDIPFVRLGSSTGIGDIGINYRYQLLGDGDAAVAVTPRASLLLPTGAWKRSRGNGAVGGEIAIAGSFVLSPILTAHSNAGIMVTPSAKNAAGEEASIHEWSIGQSLILTSSNVIQPMVEAVYARGSEVSGAGRTVDVESFLIAPGARMAFNFSSGLQIVPGFAVPIGLGASKGERGMFFYLSFEHRFTH
jgi:hypothetical protein